jgi:hypothetical protein
MLLVEVANDITFLFECIVTSMFLASRAGWAPHVHPSLHPIRAFAPQAKDRLRSGLNMLVINFVERFSRVHDFVLQVPPFRRFPFEIS